MKLTLSLSILILSASTSLYSSEYFGFQTINIINLQDNTKCSGTLLNTENGCHAVTSAHCVKGLALGEENIIITPNKNSKANTDLGRELYSKIIFSPKEAHRSSLVKAKPSSDLAQIYFDSSWAPEFCKDEYKLNLQNTKRHRHINEVYSAQEQNTQGPVNQHIAGSMGNTHSPNPTIYYRPSQNFVLAAAGFQNDTATLLSVTSVEFDSFSVIEDKMKSRLYVEYSSLPGFDFIYQVAGINLSQGMSGGVLFEVNDNQSDSERINLNFKGLSASFYPFQWKSNFIPASYILEFLKDYQDDQSDNYEIRLDNNIQVASDKLSAKEEEAIRKLKEAGEIPNIVEIKKPSYQLLRQTGEQRIQRAQVRYSDTDQDDVNGDVSLSCDWVPSTVDPIFDVMPPITNCFDLSQTRYGHTGVVVKEHPEQILIGYKNRQINGLSDLRSLQNSNDFEEKNLIMRSFGEYPNFNLRENILNNLSGVYLSQENTAVSSQAFHSYAHLGESFTRQYQIRPSSNVLIRESIVHETPLYGDLFKDLFNYNISNSINETHKINLQLKVDEQNLKLRIKTVDDENLVFNMIPVFDQEYKKLILKTKLEIYDEMFNRISVEDFDLKCDNRSFLKLICFNEKMEFGFSSASIGNSSAEIRVAFWEDFKTKKEALNSKKLVMNYIFGAVKKSQSIERRVNFGHDLDGLKFKNILKQSQLIDVDSGDILSFINVLPNKVAQKINQPINTLNTASIFYGNELLHFIFNDQGRYGVAYDQSFKIIGVILKGKLSTSAYDIF